MQSDKNNSIVLIEKITADLAKSGKNLFYSPFSINLALQILLEGTDKDTYNELCQILAYEENQEKRQKNIQNILEIIKNEKDCELLVSNALYIAEKYNILKEYIDTIQTIYEGKSTQVDFLKESTVKEINQFCNDKTKGKIQEIIKKDQLSYLTVLIIINAIYFKGQWVNQFEVNNTQLQPFTLINSSKIKTNLMYGLFSMNVPYQTNEDFKAIALPYKGSNNQMIIVLPHKINDIVSLEPKILSNFTKFYKDFFIPSQEISVFLPKFKIHSGYELIENFKKSGIKKIFDLTQSNFSKLCSTSQLFVSSIIHKAVIEVNEQGSEAAAATSITLQDNLCDFNYVEPIEFKADHPFIFMIYNKKMNQILFYGKLFNPLTEGEKAFSKQY